MKNAGRAGIVPKDDFDINIKYKRLDAVMYDKSLYIAKKDVPLGTLPTDTTYWMKSIYGNKEPIATTVTVGVVKPDGDTITVDEDGTLHGQSKVDEMTGATADADGTSGTVPVPKAGQEDLFLSGDGTWREAGTNITVDSELSKESTNPIENRAVAEELEKKLNSDGDSKDLTATFTSNDSTNVTEWTDVGLLTSGEKHSSLFQKVATMFKNIRYLYHMLGTADISTLGEGADIGTVTGALSKLNSDLQNSMIAGIELGENWRGHCQAMKNGKLILVCFELNPQKIIKDDIIIRGLPVPFSELYLSLQAANGSYSCMLCHDGTLKVYFPNYTNLERVDCIFTYICE